MTLGKLYSKAQFLYLWHMKNKIPTTQGWEKDYMRLTGIMYLTGRTSMKLELTAVRFRPAESALPGSFEFFLFWTWLWASIISN